MNIGKCPEFSLHTTNAAMNILYVLPEAPGRNFSKICIKQMPGGIEPSMIDFKPNCFPKIVLRSCTSTSSPIFVIFFFKKVLTILSPLLLCIILKLNFLFRGHYRFTSSCKKEHRSWVSFIQIPLVVTSCKTVVQ